MNSPMNAHPAQTGAGKGKGTAVRTARLRLLVVIGVIAIVAIGYFTAVGIGNLCAIGWNDLVLLCPLGALATMIAQQALIPQAVVSVLLALVSIILLGAFFCAWICPTTLLKRAFGPKKEKSPIRAPGLTTGLAEDGGSAAAPVTVHPGCSGCDSCSSPCAPLDRNDLRRSAEDTQTPKGWKRLGLDSRHAILGASLVSTLLFAFPVFCLVCPVGLTFATVLLVMRLFAFGEVTWALILLPAIIVAELLLLPRWCERICPLGAFTSLVARFNRSFRPTVAEAKCAEARGGRCGRCFDACPKGIDPRSPKTSPVPIHECTKCRACADACPTNAISFPLRAPKLSGSALPETVSDAPETDEPVLSS